MTEITEDQYDHDLVAVLEILGRINLPQFVVDLKINQPNNYERIRLLMEREKNENFNKTNVFHRSSMEIVSNRNSNGQKQQNA